MTSEAPIVLENVNHHFGKKSLRKQILFDVCTEIGAGEIVIVTGPSGSGKTTLLTLIGALREVQDGSVRVLGSELRGASAAERKLVRRKLGIIFQAHNLLNALTASQNVQMSLLVDADMSKREAERRAHAMLDAVGLGAHAGHFPDQLSGGQRQRIAIARALATEPRLILADEPTASLDKASGREVVELMRKLAKEHGTTVVMVTHDNRILDVADRILHIEDGHLSVTRDGEAQPGAAASSPIGLAADLPEKISELSAEQFSPMVEDLHGEAQRLLAFAEMRKQGAVDGMLARALEALTAKLASLLGAARASVFVVEEGQDPQLRLAVAQDEALDVRVPLQLGIAGYVARTGRSLRVEDAYADPRFYPVVDEETGFQTRSVLACPIVDRRGRVFAVAQLLNRLDGEPFEASDELRFRSQLAPLGVILELWQEMAGR